MSTVTYTPAKISGILAMPPSKSAAHRAILCAALAKGVSTLCPIDPSQDMFATMEAVQAMGAAVSYEKETRTLTVDGSRTGTIPAGEIHCRESGSTLRFCIPIAAALGMEATFTGSGRLPERPIGCYLDCLPPTLLYFRQTHPWRIHLAGKHQLSVYHRPAVRPAPAGRRQPIDTFHPVGVRRVCGHDPFCSS